MRRWAIIVTGGLLAIALAALSLSATTATTLTLVDEQGAPVADAYVRYYYSGRLLNFVHPVTYVSQGSMVARSDAEGRVTVPGRLHLRAPFPIATPPALVIADVYAPRLHNAFGPLMPLTESRPGVFLVDSPRERLTVSDVSSSLDRWEASVRHLSSCVRDLTSTVSRTAASTDDARTMALVSELARHARTEAEALAARRAASQQDLPGR